MERGESPWKPSQELLDLEFQRKALKDIDGYVRDFAKKNDTTYVVEKNDDVITFEAQGGDFNTLRKYIESIVKTVNETLKHHKKTFAFEADDRGTRIVISVAKP